MNVTALALLAAANGVSQPPAPTPAAAPPADVRFVAKPTLTFPVTFKQERVKDIEKARLFVSRDGGHTYDLKQVIDPAKGGFQFTAGEDGVYWVQMQLQFRDGTLDPKDPSAVPPSEKLVVDTTKPVVTITAAELTGDEVTVEWQVDDKHPDDTTTKVFYKPAAGDNTSWREAPAGAVRKRSARFKPEFPGPLTVQVATADLAKNIGAMNREVGAKTASGFTPAGGVLPPPAMPGGSGETVPAPGGTFGGPAPAAPLPPKPIEPPATAERTAIAPSAPPPVADSGKPPAPPPSVPVAESGRPIAVGTGMGAPPVAPAAPAVDPTVQYSRSPRFDLNYSLDGGPSGVARIDLYVTRDDGRTWTRWSQHDGREAPLKVLLDTRFNKEVEGDYGFALVPVSGAGLSDGAPTAGTAPEMRVRVDLTQPVIKVFQPTADPNNRNALMLHWEATDRNFGKEPIAIEYAETPNGPWKSVTAPEVVPAAGGGLAKEPHRIDNAGSYSWQPPAALAGPKVYLKFTAWDLAGNRSEAITPNPVLVDLTKPKARIQGITQAGGR
jgi:hypothetical protein